MSYADDTYRFFTLFRMTRLRIVVILSEAKDLYESNTINIKVCNYRRGDPAWSPVECGVRLA